MVSGRLAPILSARLGVARARRILAMTAFLAGSASVLVFTRIENPTFAMLMLGVAGFFGDFVMPPAWTACMDMGGRYAGTVSGGMNMFGSFAGGLSPLVVGYLVAGSEGWMLPFYITAAVYLVGAVCWFFLDSATPVGQGERTLPAGALTTSPVPQG